MPAKSIGSNPIALMGSIAIAFVMLLLSNTCEGQGVIRTSSSRKMLVVGGYDAEEGRFPYMSSIRHPVIGAHICGGTLIDKNWVMTAAHCLDPEKTFSAGLSPLVYCNVYEREDQNVSKRFTAKQCYLHHLWDGDARNGGDIALCQLGRPTNVAIPGLPNVEENFTTSDAFDLIGWGSTKLRGSLADVLQIGESLRYVPPSRCNTVELWAGRIKSSMFCAGSGNLNSCKGDSGGPLLIRHDPTGANIPEDPLLDLIVGVKSFGLPRCGDEGPGAYTRVSCYRPWINCIMEGTEQDCSVHSPCGEESSSEEEAPFVCSGVQKNATFNESDALERSLNAIIFDHSETVKKILCDGLSPNAVYGVNNVSLLIRAARYHAIKSAKVLLEYGSYINYVDSKGRAPLSRAASFGSVSVAKLLIDNGADIETRDNGGNTPLAIAAFYGHYQVVELLINVGAEINSKASMGHTPLHNAARNHFSEIAKLLIQNGANIESKTDRGFTPLYVAAESNSVEVAQELIANGADIEAQSNLGFSPLHVASYKGNLQSVRLLLDENAIVDSVDSNGRSALYWAATRGHIQVIRVLLISGASKTLTSNFGETSIDVICNERLVQEQCSYNEIMMLIQLLWPY